MSTVSRLTPRTIYQLVAINLRATFFRLFETLRVILRDYHNLFFALIDLLLGIHYFLISARLTNRKSLYGETPLTTLDLIARQCRILSHDIVYELGCGTGRTCFWLRAFVKCRVIGIDHCETFIRRGERLRKWFRVEGLSFEQSEFEKADLRGATVVYLYGTALEDSEIEMLAAKFATLDAKIITVSYPLCEYDARFETVKEFKGAFPWGNATIYLNKTSA